MTRVIERRPPMGKVSAGATMSLDGFIAGPDDTGFDLPFKVWRRGRRGPDAGFDGGGARAARLSGKRGAAPT
jgi:hypothetical protein